MIEKLSDLQYAIVLALGVLLLWSVYWVFFSEEPFWSSVQIGIIAAVILGAVFYLRMKL